MIHTHVGFTGTKEGLTAIQRSSLFRVCKALQATCSLPMNLHHGDCVGADSEMHDVAEELGWRITIHPPILSKHQAFREGHESKIPKAYLSRNEDIVNDSEVMIACPKNMFEERRSGTWHAIRYAKKKSRLIYYVWPDGQVTKTSA